MTQPRAFVTRVMHQDAIDLIGDATDMEVWPDDPPPSAEVLRAKLSESDGVLINIMDRVDSALLDAAPKLRVVSQLAAGLDNVDVAECTRRGILVGSTPGILSKAVADHAMALLLSAARRVVESDKWVRGNNWELAFHPTYWLGNEVQSSTLGIVGLGQIGLEMARRAQGFDMRILYHSRNRRPDAEAQYGLTYANPRRPPVPVRLRVPALPADPRDPPPHQHRRPAKDEVDRHPGQYLPRPGCRHRRDSPGPP